MYAAAIDLHVSRMAELTVMHANVAVRRLAASGM
jgi:hypothetical protein